MSYIVNGIEYESWSGKNQAILDKLVSREVYCCMTSEMEYMLSRIWQGDDNNPFDEDDLSGAYVKVCVHCSSKYGFSEVTQKDLDIQSFEENEYKIDEDNSSYYVCPTCGDAYDSAEEAIHCERCEDETVYVCENCGKVYSNEEYWLDLDEEPDEIYEWWAVSGWLGDKLKEQGCCVIDSYGKSYWGRTTTGQAISLDGCIFNIAKNMGILEGMEHEWSVI